MAKQKTKAPKATKPIEQYEHKDKQRLNNPPVGLVDAHTDNGGFKKQTYQYDPHLDPRLQWAGKAEHTSFEVPTVSLHVHERIDPRRVIETVKRSEQPDLFSSLKDNMPLRHAVEFYKHSKGWSNRLVAGDSLLIMNSLLQKEAMGGKVQMVFFDPPYGIKYGSNFQPFVNKRDVKEKDEDLTAEPEMIKAFRDTWELGIHSYLTYLRDRLKLAKDLLHESGSIFVQISDENVHHVRELMDEVFGSDNFIAQVNFKSMTPLGSKDLSKVYDYLVWYCVDKEKVKYRPLFVPKKLEGNSEFSFLDEGNGAYRKFSPEEFSMEDAFLSRVFKRSDLVSSGFTPSCVYEITFQGEKFNPRSNKSWRTHKIGMDNLISKNRVFKLGDRIYFKMFYRDFEFIGLENSWTDTAGGFTDTKKYVVETNPKVVQRCLLMATDPGDLVLDITCGSGTTAYVAENWGRRWITCDTSRVALTLAKQRLMTANFDYYELAHPNEGVGSGFKYKTVPHVTLKSVANNEVAPSETLYDQPIIDNRRTRVTGPFTFEAVPAPVVKSFEEVGSNNSDRADSSLSRSGETLRQNEWKDELLRSGVRAKGGKTIEFSRVETLSGTKYLQAEAETKVESSNKNLFDKKQQTLLQQPQRVVICFGPEHAPLEQRTVELALEEAAHMKPKPHMVLFCAFQFDEEASKDIDETNFPGVTLLKAQMNADLLTDDLKKKRSSNESFWLIGQPDVTMRKCNPKLDTVYEILDMKDQQVVEVNGFDYYNPKTGTVESGGKGDIAMWMLDTDYDGRSLFPSQVFFPMAGAKEGWATIAKNLKAEIDEEKIEAFTGTKSLPFTPGKAVAVKIIDARGIESLKIIRI